MLGNLIFNIEPVDKQTDIDYDLIKYFEKHYYVFGVGHIHTYIDGAGNTI